MSQEVALDELAAAMAEHDYAYLLTQAADKAPHAVAVVPTLDGSALVVAEAGKRTRANVTAHPLVALVWPPRQPGDYSLIVDGSASVASDDGSIAIIPSRAVHHRPAPGMSDQPSACLSDCVEIPVTG